MKPPAFQFYPDDFIGGTCDLTQAEVGAYIRLLCYQWGRGSVPEDTEKLARIAGGPVSDDVRAKFPGGVNERLEGERRKQAEYREERSRSGAMGANRRWHSHGTANSSANGLANGSANQQPMANGMANDGSPSPSPSPTPSNTLVVCDTKAPTAKKAKRLTHEEFLANIKADPTYTGIDIDRALGRCRLWCETNGKEFSPRRIVNWLNNERPIATNGRRRPESGQIEEHLELPIIRL